VKIELHVHTNFSLDGLNSPQEMVSSAISKGIDCICITDHSEIRGAEEALLYAFSKPILVIPGIEIKSKEGHILGINVKKHIPDGLSARETIIEIDKLGGMAIIAHPFAWPKNFKGNLKKTIEETRDHFVAIEVFNAAILNYANKKALEFAKSLNLPITVGSDTHEIDSIGRASLEIEGENLSVNKIFEEIKKRNVKIKSENISFFKKITDVLKRHFRKLKRGKFRV